MNRNRTKEWNEYPLGTKAYAINGGYWIKVRRGWKWRNGSTFPSPGGDCISIEEPEHASVFANI